MSEQVQAQQEPKGSWQLKAIMLVSMLPLILAYLAYYTGFGVSENTVNKGRIISPAINLKEHVEQLEGSPDWNRNKWRIFLPVSDSCDEICQHHFYVTRQVHIRLGEKSDRIQRFAVNLGGEQGSAYLDSLKEEHPLLKRFAFDKAKWQSLMSASDVPSLAAGHHYLMVDPQGFAMMVYPANVEGGDLLKDIKKILRYAPED